MTRSQQEALFEEWLKDHKGIILKVTRSFTDSKEDLDDLFQDILVQIWLAMPSYRQESKTSTWIYRIALNKALTWDKADKKKKARHMPWVEIADPETLKSRALLDQLYREIRGLEGIDRSLILLFLDGFSYREMADITGMTESYVGVRLNRAKKKLSKRMKEQSHEF